MRRTWKILAWTLGGLAVLAVVLVGFLVLAANMDWGRSLVEKAATQFSGGQIRVSGISGHFPDDLRLAHAEVRDAEGPWIIVDDVTLQWSPSRLTRKDLKVELLRAVRVQLLRLPPPSSESRKEPVELPGRIDVDRIEVNRMDIGAPIAGAAATVTLQGDAHITSLTDAETMLVVTRLDAPGTYKLNARVDSSLLKGEFVVDEPKHGLVSGLANLPDLGALSIQLTIDGPRTAEATRFALAAGPLRASGHGLVDLVGRTVDVDLTANAPEMAPRRDLSWKSMALQAHVHGPFTRPDATGQLRVDELNAGDARLRSLRADLEGNRGAVTLHAVLDRLRIPGPKPALFESAPVDLRADVRLDDPARPVTFAVSHPLLAVRGHANTGGELSGGGTVTAPSLAPFAAIAGVDLKGQTAFKAEVTTHDQATEVTVQGTVGVSGGAAPLPVLMGNAARVDVALTVRGDEITVKRAQVDGKTVRLSATGMTTRDKLDFDWKASLSDVAVLSSSVSGRIEAQGRVQGARDNLDVTADATGDVGTEGFPRGPIKASVRLRGLPASPSGKIEANGSFNGSPLQVALALDRGRDGALHSTIEHADWKSVHAEGELTFRAGEPMPQGRVAMRIAQLDDLQPWIGQPVQGGATANVDLVQAAGHVQTRIQIEARNAGVPGSLVDHVTVTGRVDDPTTHAVAALQVVADGVASNGVTGNVRLEVNGPQEALKLKLTSELHHATHGDVPLNATATLDATARQLSLATLQGQYKGQPVLLLAPVRISFRDGVAVDRLRIGMQQAVLDASGRILPALDLTASLRNVTPAVARTFDADLQADGVLTMDARLTGTLEQPRGTVKVAANGLRMRTGPAARLPAVNVTANAELDAQSARFDAKLSAGSQTRLDATGRVPLSASGPIELHTNGTIDAAMANPILEVDGRRVKGKVAVELRVSGTLAAPRIDGSLRLADGEIQDYALGMHLTKVDALVEAAGDTLRIANFTAHAGDGTVSASGTVAVFATGRPVDVKLTARNAKPFATDLLMASLDADITLRGQSQTRVDAGGSIKIQRADINIPKALPPTVAVLDVRRPGQKPAPSPAPGPVIGLDLSIDAPRAVFVRGRGLDAETGGELHVTGTSASPQIGGGFDLRRGTFDLGGSSLKFTSGKVSFNGTGLSQKIDPMLDFAAESTISNITARLTVTGYADAPKIALSSSPEMPQDEIVARLLFGVSAKELTALQLAQIAAAVASVAGVGGDGNPLMAVQKSLGLDRLSASSTPTGGASVEAGRYVSERVYVGAKQNTQGGTQAQVQFDLTKNLKLQATLGTGGTVPVQGTTPDNDPGSSVGFSYQFEY